MAERPIYLTGPEVRAVVAGVKTQARRPLREQPGYGPSYHLERGQTSWPIGGARSIISGSLPPPEFVARCPFGRPGDRLWVRERHAIWSREEEDPGEPRRGVYYEAGTPDPRAPHGWRCVAPQLIGGRWSSPVQMPRWAARYFLEIVAVRVEHLQDITAADAQAEGLRRVSKDGGRTWKWGMADRDGLPGTDDDGTPWRDWSVDARNPFKLSWDRTHGSAAPWESNPWVWVVEFKRVVDQQMELAR